MKKIFTLALAAAATLGASAAGFNVIQRTSLENSNLTCKNANIAPIATSRADGGPASIDGDYAMTALRTAQQGNFKWSHAGSIETIEETELQSGEQAQIVELQNFFTETFANNDQTYADVDPIQAVYVPSMGILAIPNGTYVLTSDGIQMSMYFYFKSARDGKNYYTEQEIDIQFIVNEDGSLSLNKDMMEGGDEFLGFLVGGKSGGQFLSYAPFTEVNLVQPNGTFTANEVYNGQSTPFEDIIKVERKNDKIITITNFIAQGWDVAPEFVIDADKKTAVATKQVGLITSYQDGSEAILYLNDCDADGEPTNQDFIVNGTVSDNGKEITFEGVALFDDNGTAYPAYYTDIVVKLPFNVLEAGSIDTVGSENANAPVEYFNLQGMRVNEPAAGSIVIRRQGTEVSKILVK